MKGRSDREDVPDQIMVVSDPGRRAVRVLLFYPACTAAGGRCAPADCRQAGEARSVIKDGLQVRLCSEKTSRNM